MAKRGELLRFGCVGATAALVHFLVVTLLVPRGINPLVANVAAFATAWHFSYYGHRSFTFRARGGRGEYGRMLFTSLAALAAQELLYALMLRLSPFDYRLSLFLVLLLVAAGTFIASRCWVFTTRKDMP